MLFRSIIEYDLPFRKTHAIYVLWQELTEHGIQSGLTEEDCDLFDAVYMPSRYPLFSVLPDAMPDRETCEKCIHIARRVGESARSALKDKEEKVGNNT